MYPKYKLLLQQTALRPISPAGDQQRTVLTLMGRVRTSQDSCHVWDPLLDRSQENQSVASMERTHSGPCLFVYGPAEWRTLRIKKAAWQNTLLHTERRQWLSRRSVKFMLWIFMQMQIFSLISLFLINVIQFLIICLSSQQLQVQLQ
jgi:hypothetical protein